tara:strand:+ start:157 stop:408 length:252 start_codon:yes stop_codon:yes gene_type:complete
MEVSGLELDQSLQLVVLKLQLVQKFIMCLPQQVHLRYQPGRALLNMCLLVVVVELVDHNITMEEVVLVVTGLDQQHLIQEIML